MSDILINVQKAEPVLLAIMFMPEFAAQDVANTIAENTFALSAKVLDANTVEFTTGSENSYVTHTLHAGEVLVLDNSLEIMDYETFSTQYMRLFDMPAPTDDCCKETKERLEDLEKTISSIKTTLETLKPKETKKDAKVKEPEEESKKDA